MKQCFCSLSLLLFLFFLMVPAHGESALDEDLRGSGISAARVCDLLWLEQRPGCLNFVDSQKFQAAAVQICLYAGFSEKKLECLGLIAGKFFDVDQAMSCARIGAGEARLDCVRNLQPLAKEQPISVKFTVSRWDWEPEDAWLRTINAAVSSCNYWNFAAIQDKRWRKNQCDTRYSWQKDHYQPYTTCFVDVYCKNDKNATP
jgi:hypothetical protein